MSKVIKRVRVIVLGVLLSWSAVSAATTSLSGAAFDVGFSPGAGANTALSVVLHSIERAASSILIASYSFTSKPIAIALLQARQRGVHVQVVADAKENSKRYTAVQFLANAGVPVRLNHRYAIHHHKFMVIDGMHVETGSFNYTAAAAARNAENALVLWNVKPLADVYTREWQRLWQESDTLPAAY